LAAAEPGDKKHRAPRAEMAGGPGKRRWLQERSFEPNLGRSRRSGPIFWFFADVRGSIGRGQVPHLLS
jgi:hypothetical protein